jgi:hypothetical protein
MAAAGTTDAASVTAVSTGVDTSAAMIVGASPDVVSKDADQTKARMASAAANLAVEVVDITEVADRAVADAGRRLQNIK